MNQVISFSSSTHSVARPRMTASSLSIAARKSFGGFGHKESARLLARSNAVMAAADTHSDVAAAPIGEVHSDFLDDVRRVIASAVPSAKKQEMLIALQSHYRDRFIGLDS